MSQTGIVLFLMALAAQGNHAKIERAQTSCLAQAMYYEARGEGRRGEEAVAEVILDRMKSGRHPKTVCGVVHEPHQFSFLGDGSMLRPIEQDAWKAALHLAQRILKGDVVTALTRKAQYYHEVSVHPDWAAALVRTARIGNHIFYREKRKS